MPSPLPVTMLRVSVWLLGLLERAAGGEPEAVAELRALDELLGAGKERG